MEYQGAKWRFFAIVLVCNQYFLEITFKAAKDTLFGAPLKIGKGGRLKFL